MLAAGTTRDKGFVYLYSASFVTGRRSNSSCLMAAPSLSHSVLPGDGQGFTLDDFTQAKSSQPFMRDLRQICEIMFDLLLQSYISSLDAYYQNCFVGNGKKEGRHEWEEALCLASDALEKFRVAETMRQDPDKANATVQDAMDILKRSINKVPIIDKTKLIMSDWDDGEV